MKELPLVVFVWLSHLRWMDFLAPHEFRWGGRGKYVLVPSSLHLHRYRI